MPKLLLAGSLISSTHRTQDLIPTFLQALKSVNDDNSVNERISSISTLDDDAQWWYTEPAIDMLDELFDELGNYTPENFYFGAHIGDGSDFGVWEYEEEFAS